MTQSIIVFESDIGTRRIDAELIDDVQQFAIVMDRNEITGNSIPCVEIQWNAGFGSVELAEDMAARIAEAVTWAQNP